MFEQSDLIEASRRHARYYLKQIAASYKRYQEGGDHMRAALEELEARLPQIQQAFAFAAEHSPYHNEDAALVVEFIRAGWSLLALRQTFDTQARWLENAIEAARRTNDQAGLVEALHRYGSVLIETGQTEQALTAAREAYDLAEAAGDLPGQVYALRVVGMVQFISAEFNAARETMLRAMAMGEGMSELEPSLRTAILSNLGSIAFRTGDQQLAVAYHTQALDLNRQRDNLPAIALSLHNLAGAYWSMGDYDSAKRYYLETLALRRQLQDQRGTASTLVSLGTIYAIERNFAQARQAWEESLDIARRNGLRAMIGYNLLNLGAAARDMGELERSQDYFEESLIVFREVGNRFGEANVVVNMALIALGRGDHDTGAEYVRETIRLSRDSGMNPVLLRAVVGWAWRAALLGDAKYGAALLGLVSVSPGNEESVLQTDFDDVSAYLRTMLSNDAFDAAYRDGQQLDLETILTSILAL